MIQVPIEFACRYWFPRNDRQLTFVRGTNLPIIDDWRWHHYRLTMTVTMPSTSGEAFVWQLPAPFFTFSAASYNRLYFQCAGPGRIDWAMDLDSYRVVNWERWRTSELWTRVNFDAGNDGYPHRSPWTLWYRTPDAKDLPARMMSTLDAVDQAATLDEARQAVDTMRREILLWTLAGGRTS